MGLIDNDFLNGLAPQEEPKAAPQKGSLTIRVDADAFLHCDGEFVDVELKANKITRIELAAGQHILEFTGVADSTVAEERIVDIEPGKSQLLLIQGLGPKSAEEQKADKLEQFKKEIQARLDDDRKIDSQEAAELEALRQKMGIDPKTAQTLINEARRQVRQNGRTASESKSFSVEVMQDAIAKNDADKVQTFLPDLAAALEVVPAETPEGSMMRSLYYMCLGAIDSKALIQNHESSYVDDYWRTYWVLVAYSRNKQRAKVADTLADLEEIYEDYPDDNLDLLRVVDALNNLGREEALRLFQSHMDGNYSVELTNLARAVRFELELEKPATREQEQECEFLQDRVVSFEDMTTRQLRKEKKLAEARKQITYTLSITAVTDLMLGMMTARTVLGWASAESRQKFGALPVIVMETNDRLKVESVNETLQKGGIKTQLDAVNALGENVSLVMAAKGGAAREGYEVVLTKAGSNKIQIIKIIKENLNLDFKESKDLVDSAPSRLCVFSSKKEAEKLAKELQQEGAVTVIKEI